MDLRLAAELGLDRQRRDRQLDFSPQSPQPSQTRSLIKMRSAGSGALPRLRLRRSSAAHSWSWISTVTPVDLGQLALGLEQLVAVAHLGDRRERHAAVALGLLGGDDDPPDALELEPAGELAARSCRPRRPARRSSRRRR